MKKTLLISTLLAFIFTLNSCSTDDNTGASNEDIQVDLVVKKLTQTRPSQDPPCMSSHITFNTFGKIDAKYVCNDTLLSRTYSYNNDNLITGVSGYGTYVYDGNRMSQIIRGTDASSAITDISYEGNFIVERSTYGGEEYEGESIYEFTDATYSKLMKITTSYDLSTDPYIAVRTTFEYEGDNLTKETHEQIDQNTQDLELYSTTTYAYDDQRNPYQLGLNQNPHVVVKYPLLYNISTGINIARQSNHNITSYTSIVFSNNSETTYSYDYQYNEDNYPENYDYSINGELFAVGMFEYY